MTTAFNTQDLDDTAASDWLDPDRPNEDDILGRAWVAVPHLGRILDLPSRDGLSELSAPRHRRRRTAASWPSP